MSGLCERHETSEAFNRIGKKCITRIEGPRVTKDYEKHSLSPNFLVQFPNLKYVDNTPILLQTLEDAEEMAQVSDLQKGVFLLMGEDGATNQAILDTYINSLCANAGESLLGRYLAPGCIGVELNLGYRAVTPIPL